MRYAIFADIHANLEGLDAVLADAGTQGVDEFACLGDIVGYNADPVACVQRVRALNCPVVLGNHDEEAVRNHPLDRMSPLAAAAMEWTRNQLDEEIRRWFAGVRLVRQVRTMTLVHSSLDSPENWTYVVNRWDAMASFAYQFTPVCFHGHTHVPAVYVKRGRVEQLSEMAVKLESGTKYFINVGSAGQPRDGDWRASYAIYDNEAHTVEIRRVEYDIDLTQKKILDAGLPELLANRLGSGR